MIGMLVTSHGNFCTGIINSLEMISGANDAIYSLKLDDNGIGDYSKRLHEKLDKMTKKYDGIIIFSDINGGTPYNECFRYILEKKSNIRLISGMNLPMLIETSLSLSNVDGLDSLVSIAIEAGRVSIEELNIIGNDNDLDIL